MNQQIWSVFVNGGPVHNDIFGSFFLVWLSSINWTMLSYSGWNGSCMFYHVGWAEPCCAVPCRAVLGRADQSLTRLELNVDHWLVAAALSLRWRCSDFQTPLVSGSLTTGDSLRSLTKIFLLFLKKKKNTLCTSIYSYSVDKGLFVIHRLKTKCKKL